MNLPKRCKNLIGQTFFGIKVISFAFQQARKSFWLCECHCSKLFTTRSDSLISGAIKSCGCLKKTYPITHGFHRRTNDPLEISFYKNWNGMKSRCFNPDHPKYYMYGGRGIKVCKRWLKFENFRDDMYEGFLKHVEEFGRDNTSIDRFPNQSGNYEPSNCRWATWKEQSENTESYTKSKNIKQHRSNQALLQSLLLRILFKNTITTSRNLKYIGCTPEEFRKHIESQFEPGMHWKNHGQGKGLWQLDHIIGCNNFDLSKEKDKYLCFNYKNLRPMWTLGNNTKSRRKLKLA